MLEGKFSDWCIKLQQSTLAKRWRSLLVLVGDENWTAQQLDASLPVFLSGENAHEQGLVYGDAGNIGCYRALQSVNRKNYTQYLGTEQRVVLFSATPDLTTNLPSSLTPNFTANLKSSLAANSASKTVNEIDKQAAPNRENSVSDFDVDAFAALSGTLLAGGVFILLLKPSQIEALDHLHSTDYFLQRFLRQLSGEHCYFISQEQAHLPELSALSLDTKADSNDTANTQAITSVNLDIKASDDTAIIDNQISISQARLLAQPYGCVTQEQTLAVDAILKVLYGHRDRPLVLTADRGRGKSSALALAACQMLKTAKQPIDIIITAPSKQALKVFFSQIEKHLPGAQLYATRVEHNKSRISFYPIDVILKEQPVANIMMVDEAAALPVHLLQLLLSHYHRLVFATTIHGYEGAGRGFSIKFRQVLQRLMPNWRKMHINEAIRWANDDPLEQFVFDSCLLNATLPSYENTLLATKGVTTEQGVEKQTKIVGKENLSVELIGVEQLLENENLLRAVFAVLVTAHYQTSPSDIRLLLNNQAISLFVLKRQDDVLGVVMLIREGLANEALVELVRDNQRRLRDQFLPQSLLMHCGVKQSFKFSYQRVMRIAIHPQFQEQGLGSYLLNSLEQHVTAQGVDFIGASFAGNANLVRFWQQAEFIVARVGFSKDKASGEHSCVVIKALTPKAITLQQTITQQFYQQFDYWLTDEFKYLPAKLVWQLLNANVELKSRALTQDILLAVNDFSSGQRQYSGCVYALHQWLLWHCAEQKCAEQKCAEQKAAEQDCAEQYEATQCETGPFNADVLPLLARILQKHSVEQVCQQYGFTGKKALNQHLMAYIAQHQN